MSVNIRQTAFALGMVEQADLVTENSGAEFFRPTKVNQQLAEAKPNTESNAQDLGKDDEFATQVFLVSKDSGFQLECFTTSEMAAFAFAFGLGNSAATSPDPPAVRHTAVPQSSGIDLRSFSYVEKLPADGTYLDRLLRGCVVAGWTLQLNSGVGRQNSKLIIDVVGTGSEERPSGVTLPAPTTLHGLNAGSATITINGTNYITAKAIISLECGFRNNVRLDSGFFPGSGTEDGFNIRGRMEHGDREAFLRFVARLRTSSDEFTKLFAQTEGTAVITLTGAAIASSVNPHDLSITFHRVTFASAVVDQADGIATVSVECGVLKHASNGLMTAYATNEIALFGGET
jgi:hypothetical protein